MSKSRIALLASSGVVIAALLGGGWFVRIGAADETYRQVMLFSDVLALVAENYVDPVESDGLVAGAYEAMMSNLDPRGAFLTREEVEEWAERGALGSAGPGFSALKAYGGLQIVSVFADSPAAAAGLKAGDQIRRIDGRELRDLSWDQCNRLIEGQAGSTLRLAVVHPEETFEDKEIELTRQLRRDRAHRISVSDGVAVLTIADLARLDAKQVASDLGDVDSRGVDRLLVDLRNLVDDSPRDAVGLASLLSEGGPAFLLRDRGGNVAETVELPARAPAWDGALGVLVNGATAGAAEALASLLRSRTEALVIGETTYGLGTEVDLFRLPDGSGVLVSTARWEVPDGSSWAPAGLTPDLTVRPRGRDVAARLEDQLEQAIRVFTESLREETPSEVREAA